MTNLAQIAAVIGFALPLVVAVVQQHHWPRWLKTIIGVVCALAASIATPAIYTNLTWHTWGTSFVVILVAMLTTYRNVWEPVGATPFIEAKTTIGSPPAS
jgi:peptidoglycan/LPS O-acetylase OafA/YrhL